MSAGGPRRAAAIVSGRELRQVPAASDQSVGGEHARAAAVGEDGEAVAAQGTRARQRLDGVEQVVGLEDAQHAGAAEGGVVDVVGAGQGAGVRGAARAPSGKRPALMAISGLLRAAARAADMNLRAPRIDSM